MGSTPSGFPASLQSVVRMPLKSTRATVSPPKCATQPGNLYCSGGAFEMSESTLVPSVSTLPLLRSARRKSLPLVSAKATWPSLSSTTLLSWANVPGSFCSSVSPPCPSAGEQATMANSRAQYGWTSFIRDPRSVAGSVGRRGRQRNAQQPDAVARRLGRQRRSPADRDDTARARETDLFRQPAQSIHDVITAARIDRCPALLEPYEPVRTREAGLEGRLDRSEGELLGRAPELGRKLADEQLAIVPRYLEHPVGQVLAAMPMTRRIPPVHPVGVHPRHPQGSVRQRAPLIHSAEDPALESAAGVALHLGDVQRRQVRHRIGPLEPGRGADHGRRVAVALAIGPGMGTQLVLVASFAVARPREHPPPGAAGGRGAEELSVDGPPRAAATAPVAGGGGVPRG